jgi:hypothetical protein
MVRKMDGGQLKQHSFSPHWRLFLQWDYRLRIVPGSFPISHARSCPEHLNRDRAAVVERPWLIVATIVLQNRYLAQAY